MRDLRRGNLKCIAALVAAAALSTITAASGADLPAQTYTKAFPYVPPLFDWAGFYVGGNLGYSWGRSSNSATVEDFLTGTVAGIATSRDNVNGFIGGAQAGYNWKLSNWVAGLEADFQGSGERGSTGLICPGCGDGPSDITATLTQKLDWFGTARGRAGVLITPDVLLYGTAGLAYGEVQTTASITGPSVASPTTVFALTGQNSLRAGWTAGTGVEAHVGGNWTVKLEYLYMDLGSVSVVPVQTTILGTRRNLLGASYSSAFTDNVLRFGFNYVFNSPLVARY
jgi:outer membrane immunogenic protein